MNFIWECLLPIDVCYSSPVLCPTLAQLLGVPTVHRAVDSYEYLSGTALECPIYSFGGIHDGEQDIAAWAMETSSDRSESALYPGGGFYLLDPDNEVSMKNRMEPLIPFLGVFTPWHHFNAKPHTMGEPLAL